MKGLQAGAVAGVVRGISAVPIYVAALSLGVFPSLGYDLGYLLIHEIVMCGIWGAMWGVLAPYLYDKIPSKGIMKGIVYSMMIFVLTNVYTAALLSKGFPAELPVMMATAFIWMGFWSWLVYGAVFGALYKK